MFKVGSKIKFKSDYYHNFDLQNNYLHSLGCQNESELFLKTFTIKDITYDSANRQRIWILEDTNHDSWNWWMSERFELANRLRITRKTVVNKLP